MPASLKAWSARTFSALKHPNFRRFWLSQLLSLIGSWMQTTAQQYLVLELSHGSSAALGMVTGTQFLPSLLLSLVAGAVIDRLPRRRVLLATQTTLLLCSAVLAVSTHLGVVSLPLVMVMAFIAGTANAFDMPARQSMVVDFVPRESVPNAVALNSLSFNASRTVGQALFGIVAAVGVRLFAGGDSGNISHLALPFYLNLLSFFYVLYVIATLPFPPREPHLRTCVKTRTRFPRAKSPSSSRSSMRSLPLCCARRRSMMTSCVCGSRGQSSRYGWQHTLRSCIISLSRRRFPTMRSVVRLACSRVRTGFAQFVPLLLRRFGAF